MINLCTDSVFKQAYADIYIALCYAIFYSFFEVFPLVYIERYGFNVGEMGLVFLSIAVGVVISIAGYYAYLYYVVEKEIREHGFGAPERRLIPALFSSFLVPIGLFIFAWTGDGKIHWIVSCIGIVINMIGVFILFQCVFVYLPMVYPAYAGSLFAGNDTMRSTLAAAAILFSRPMFLGLGVGGGVSLLAGLTTLCIGGIFILFFYGEKLRAKSRFAAK
jgi:DHA1 family multidrug resistance protein-like MFS transporter